MEKFPLGFKSGPTKILVIKGFPVSGNSVTNIPPFLYTYDRLSNVV